MKKSCELRWFMNEDQAGLIQLLHDWFVQHGKPKDQLLDTGRPLRREDYYFKSAGKSPGIKIREDSKIELKNFIRDAPEVQVPRGSGKAKEWIKFSFGLKNGLLSSDAELNEIIASFKDDDARNSYWLKMGKDRLLVQYNAQTGKMTSGIIPIKEGCGIELTRLKIEGENYYTFGLEAFSEKGQEAQNLQKAIGQIRGLLGDAAFTDTDCIDYPEFIERLRQESRIR